LSAGTVSAARVKPSTRIFPKTRLCGISGSGWSLPRRPRSRLALVGTGGKEALLAATERFNVIAQLRNLMSYPLVRERVLEGRLFLQGWYYHIADGTVEYFDPVSHAFKPIDEIVERIR